MITDARTLPKDIELHAAVCIVGAGAAGITLALELSHASIDVVLLESGGMESDQETQSLYKGDVVGFPYYPLDVSRVRFFGGTTNHWDGLCRPLEESDFEERPWIPDSGWPIRKSTLDPFYRRAHVICKLGRYDYDPAGWETAERKRLPLYGGRIRTEILQSSSPPTNFGRSYREDIERSGTVRAYTYANAIDVEAATNGREISGIRVATLEGGEFRVRARIFVLATGAIENARLLLTSNKVHRAGLGNDHDLVGRYFMEHLHVPGVVLLPSDPGFEIGLYNWRDRDHLRREDDGAVGFGFLMSSPELQARERIAGVRVVMRRVGEFEALEATSKGVYSFDWLVDEVVRQSQAPAGKQGTEGGFAKHLLRVITDLDNVGIYAYRRIFRPSRDFPGFYLIYSMEQVPNPESRVYLGRERDPLGMPRVRLDWRFTDTDRRTYERFTQFLAQELGAASLGRVKTVTEDPQAGWPMVREGLRGAWHQMGTTRMHSDPRHGVVDEHCRVHTVSNLFLASSSVFPTSGIANPTLTIVALTIRLADHIKELLS